MYNQEPTIKEYQKRKIEILALADEGDEQQIKDLVQSLFDKEQLHFQILLRFEREKIATRQKIGGVNLTMYRQMLGTVWYYLCLCIDVINYKKIDSPDAVHNNMTYILILLEKRQLGEMYDILFSKLFVEN